MLIAPGRIGRIGASRLRVLPGLPAPDELLTLALDRIGVDFSEAGIRTPTTKRVGVDALPAGVTIGSGDLIRFADGINVTMSGWDFTGYSVYADRGTIALMDCKLSKGNKPCLDVRGAAAVTATHCNFDGASATSSSTDLVIQRDTASTMTLTDSIFEKCGADCIKPASNSIIERNWFRDLGYDAAAHSDIIQVSVQAILHQNIAIRLNLFDARITNAMTVNNAVRAVSENGSSINRLLIEENVMALPNAAQPPFAIGVGVGALNVAVQDNWLRYVTASPVLGNEAAQPQNPLWINNRRLDSGELIPAPLGWLDTAVAPLAYAMLHDFEALGTLTNPAGSVASLHTGDRKVLNSAGVRIEGTAANTGAMGASNVVTTTEDAAAWQIIAICVDCGTGPECNVASLRPSFSTGIGGAYAYRIPSGVTFNDPFTNVTRGKRWQSFRAQDFKQTNYAGPSIGSLGTGNKIMGLSLSSPTTTNGNPDIVVDAAVRPAFHKPAIMFTFDDLNANQYTAGFPAMQSRGLVGSLYVPWGFVGGASRVTLAQLQEMHAAGWAMCVDSDDQDRPMSHYATVAEAIAALNANRDAIVAEFGAAGAAHMCYSYGRNGYSSSSAFTTTVTANGTTSVTVPGTAAYASITPGMRVRGTNVPAGTVVVRPTAQGTVLLNQSIPNTVTSMTFMARETGLTVTANGTITVTVSNTQNLFAGMHMLGYTVPAETRIVSVDSGTQITVDKAVPATCLRANFGDVDNEWWPTNLADAMLAEGYVTGRGVNGFAGIYTGYGVDPLATINIQGLSLDNAGQTATLIAQLRQCVDERRDVITYAHNFTDMTHWNAIFDVVAGWVAAGECDVLTVPEWWATATARAPIA